MDITNIISEEYERLDPDERLSSLVGIFDDPAVKGVIVHGDEYEGVVTRRQLATSHHKPAEKVGSIVRHVARLEPATGVREAAQLMIDGDTRLLPVFEHDVLIGVVTDDAILRAVEEYLNVATVADVHSPDPVGVIPEDTFGTAVNQFREHRITHLPVLNDGQPVGILSLHDITAMTIRATEQSQGGDPGGVDPMGGDISRRAARSRRGGYGAREGELSRMLELPVGDLMSAPVETIEPTATLDRAVAAMFDINGSSLVVVEDDQVVGIVTKTDILDALTWEAPESRAVQIYGIELLDDVNYDSVVSMIERFDDRDRGMQLLDAKIHLHEHDETLRGSPLILARIRLHTDRGMYITEGEGYGARSAINEARDKLERQIQDRKASQQSKKPPSKEFWEFRFGWLPEP